MLFQCVKTYIGSKQVVANFPNKKSIVLRGNNGEQILYVLESLLSQDYTNYYLDLDRKNFGLSYTELEKPSQLDFTNGFILGKDRTVTFTGQVPAIHCIRYVGDGTVRSFLSSKEKLFSSLDINTKHYNSILPLAVWMRMLAVVNDILGFKFVDFVDGDIAFKFDENSEYSVDAQKLVYTLVSECFLTPQGYARVLLLSNLDYLTVEQKVHLIEKIDNLQGHSALITTCNISIDDVSDNSAITFLNV